MNWQNYAGFKATILKNDAFIGEYNLQGFILTNEVLSQYQSRYDSASSLNPWGGAYVGSSNWSDFEYAAANTSPELKSQGLLELLTNNGDTIKIYCSNVGPRYCLCLTRSDSGEYKRIKRWYIGAGTAYDYNEYTIYDGGNYSLCIGFLVDGYRALPYAIMSALNPSNPYYNTATFVPWQGWSKSSFESTHSYNYFFVISDAWQPPTPPTPSSDPYADGGTSTMGGGEGSFDDESDEIDVPSVPALNLSLNHFISTYAPTLAQLNDLADFMWSDWLSQGPTLSKIFADPSDAIISLHMLPFTPATATAVTVTIGSFSTGVSMDPMTLQFYTIDCGELAIEEYWGNYLDYNPYTKLTLFLPYVGEVTLNPDEVMGQTIGIKYRIDALTGAFVCFLSRADKKIVGQYQGNCALEVPVSSANYARLHAALLELAAAAVSAGAGIAKGAAAKKGAVKNASRALLNEAPEVIDSAVGVMDSKVSHSHSGAIGSAAGFLGSQKPYLIIERARQCLPDGLNEFAGYPSQVTARLGDQTGFTSVSEIILDGIPLTDGELSELREILQGGIYV